MMEDTYMSKDEFGASTSTVVHSETYSVRAGLPAKQVNVGNLERFICIIAGFSGLFLLSRRLFIYLGLALFSAYLLYRGMTGYCLIYERANIDTSGGRKTRNLSDQDNAPSRNTPVATPVPPTEYADDPIDGRIEEASWESFPASDPPGF